jgi:hypothetical protein
MGIGSPRLLGQFVRRTAAVALVALALAPSAFADDGSGVGIAAIAGPVAAVVAVDAAPAPTVQVTASVTAPAPVSAASVPVAVRVSAEGASPSVRVSTPFVDAPRAPQRSTVATPRRPLTVHAPAKTATAPADRRSTRVASLGNGRLPGVSAPEVQLPPLPLPAPSGFAAAAAGAPTGGTLTLLLLVLAAALVLAVPRLARKVSLRLAAPRPFPYLLRLERPD